MLSLALCTHGPVCCSVRPSMPLSPSPRSKESKARHQPSPAHPTSRSSTTSSPAAPVHGCDADAGLEVLGGDGGADTAASAMALLVDGTTPTTLASRVAEDGLASLFAPTAFTDAPLGAGGTDAEARLR